MNTKTENGKDTARTYFGWAILFLLVAPFWLVGFGAIVELGKFKYEPRLPPPSAVPVACLITTTPRPQTPTELYLDLLKRTLTRAQVVGMYERHTIRTPADRRGRLYAAALQFLESRGYELVRLTKPDINAYLGASDFNLGRLEDGETMVGLKQLDNIQFCVTEALQHKIPGDLIETGTWRGGVTIFMRAILKANGVTDRKVWVADSFEGLPVFNRALNPGIWTPGMMAVSFDEARQNFARYGLLDDQVRFLKGFFDKTLPGAPIGKLAVLRSDADLYESTRDVLNNLYAKLSVGGYAIFDDYGAGCKRAIDEYRAQHGITEPMKRIDELAVYWQRLR